MNEPSQNKHAVTDTGVTEAMHVRSLSNWLTTLESVRRRVFRPDYLNTGRLAVVIIWGRLSSEPGSDPKYD